MSGANRTQWRVRQDGFARRARRLGYAARAIYKLEEIDRQYGILRRGQRVLDLGAAPGSWAQYVAAQVGRSGRVLAIDRHLLRIPLHPPLEFVCGDAASLLAEALGTRQGSADLGERIPSGVGQFEVILSDMAPDTSGIAFQDAHRSAVLARVALAWAEACLKPGGTLLIKLLEGEERQMLQRELGTSFEKVFCKRPRATRRGSRECFLLGLRARAPGDFPTPARAG